MLSKRVRAALALTAILVPVASQAADTVVGTVTSGTQMVVARDGKVIKAVPGMSLYSGDRLMTRAGGAANVKMANNCAVSLGASSMVPMTNGSSCTNLNKISFDEGRAGYTGSSSSFADHNKFPLLVGALFVAWGGVMCYIVCGDHHHDHTTPVSP